MKPTPPLSIRIRFSTKSVGKGFYRGNRTGSTGAHTPGGGFMVDYRKVRHYNVPESLGTCKLTPFVTRQINENEMPATEKYSWEEDYPELYDRDHKSKEEEDNSKDEMVERRTRAMAFLRRWRQQNPQQFAEYVRWQEGDMLEEIERWRQGAGSQVVERVRRAQTEKEVYE